MTPERALRRGGHAYPSDIIDDLLVGGFIPLPLKCFEGTPASWDLSEEERAKLASYLAVADTAAKDQQELDARRRKVLEDE